MSEFLKETPVSDQDPEIQKILAESPLMLFSLYTETQSRAVRKKGLQILGELDNGIRKNDTGGITVSEVSTQDEFWFWILGAYEVVRVMALNKDKQVKGPYFSKRVTNAIVELRKRLTIYRIPFAKQQVNQEGTSPRNVRAELSIVSWSSDPGDFAYKIDGRLYWVREIVEEFERVFSAITREDIFRGIDAKIVRFTRFDRE